MKLKLLTVAAFAFVLASCGGSQEEKDAKKFCDCAGDMSELMTKMKEDPTSVDMDAMTKASEEFDKCFNMEEMKKREEGLNEEQKDAYQKKMKELVNKTCPEVAKAMGM